MIQEALIDEYLCLTWNCIWKLDKVMRVRFWNKNCQILTCKDGWHGICEEDEEQEEEEAG